MNTSQFRRTAAATSAVAAALALLTVVGAPMASAQRPDPGSRASAHLAAPDIGQVVAMRKAAAAQYYVDHALELQGARP